MIPSCDALRVIKLLRRQAPSGSLAPVRQRRPRGTGRLARYAGFLVQTVEAKPDITMPELAARLWKEHRVSALPPLCPVSSDTAPLKNS